MKLYRRPRSFTHPAWMRVSGLIWEGHICVTCVYKGRLFCSLWSSVKLCADTQISLIWIQLNAEGLLHISEAGYWDWGTPRHKKSVLERPLLVRKLWRDIYLCKRMPKPCPGGVVVPGKAEEPSDEILILTLSRACKKELSTFYLSLNSFHQNTSTGLGIDSPGLFSFKLSACQVSLDGEPYSHICGVLFFLIL